ncbi:MAG: nuclear transport factor 2 family protein [Chloroflexota bacterium]|nr:nuclear transport factor 2 family protein [Chloroflexota bacterium]
MDTTTPIAVVLAWQEAANRQDAERLLALSDPQIEIVGPRGSGYGHELLRAWLGRAGLELTTLRVFARGSVVVLAQHGIWRAAETGVVIGEADLASQYRVVAGQVVQFARHDHLDKALAAAGLSPRDEQV